MIVAETDRLVLRTWKASDRLPFARLNADSRVMEFFPKPLSAEESDRLIDRIDEQFRKHGFTFYAAELKRSGEFIGFIGLAVPRFEAHFMTCVEIGWRLAAEHWARGYATEGAREVIRVAFQTLKLAEIVSLTTTANVRSRRVMEKLAMTHDPADDFDHPGVPDGHPLQRHVLYRLKRIA
jgi:RimJ/RimL family protein N-acetyltransferase